MSLRSITPKGLPYPESTADINQGANDIKALALALDPLVPAGWPMFHAGLEGASVVANQPIKYNQVRVDVGGLWDMATGHYRCALAGKYLVNVQTKVFSAVVSTPRILFASTVNGTYAAFVAAPDGSGAMYSGANIAAVIDMPAGGGLAGADVNAYSSPDRSGNWLNIVYLGPL